MWHKWSHPSEVAALLLVAKWAGEVHSQLHICCYLLCINIIVCITIIVIC